MGDIIGEWFVGLAKVGDEYAEKRKALLSKAKNYGTWLSIRRVACYLYGCELVALGFENAKPFDDLPEGRQWHFVEQAVQALDTFGMVERALGKLADDESSKVFGILEKVASRIRKA